MFSRFLPYPLFIFRFRYYRYMCNKKKITYYGYNCDLTCFVLIFFINIHNARNFAVKIEHVDWLDLNIIYYANKLHNWIMQQTMPT